MNLDKKKALKLYNSIKETDKKSIKEFYPNILETAINLNDEELAMCTITYETMKKKKFIKKVFKNFSGLRELIMEYNSMFCLNKDLTILKLIKLYGTKIDLDNFAKHGCFITPTKKELKYIFENLTKEEQISIIYYIHAHIGLLTPVQAKERYGDLGSYFYTLGQGEK